MKPASRWLNWLVAEQAASRTLGLVYLLSVRPMAPPPAAPPSALSIAVLAALSAETEFVNSRPLQNQMTSTNKFVMGNHSQTLNSMPVCHPNARLSVDATSDDLTGLVKCAVTARCIFHISISSPLLRMQMLIPTKFFPVVDRSFLGLPVNDRFSGQFDRARMNTCEPAFPLDTTQRRNRTHGDHERPFGG